MKKAAPLSPAIPPESADLPNSQPETDVQKTEDETPAFGIQMPAEDVSEQPAQESASDTPTDDLAIPPMEGDTPATTEATYIPRWEQRRAKKSSGTMPPFNMDWLRRQGPKQDAPGPGIKIQAPKIDKTRLRGIFAKAATVGADMAARTGFTTIAKAGAVYVAIGAGASVIMTASAAIAATGVAAAVYTYGAESFKEWQHAKATGTEFKFITMDRTKKALLALACGVGFGALGTWLAQSQLGAALTVGIMGGLAATISYTTASVAAYKTAKADGTQFKFFDRRRAGKAVLALTAGVALGAVIGGLLNGGTASPTPETAATPPAPPPVEPPVTETATTPAAPVAAAAPEAAPTVAAVAAVTVSSDAVAADPLNAGLTQAGLAADADGQALKDAAHDILRDTSIAAEDRTAMARALAEQALSQGNPQAAGFLDDLAIVEAGLGQTPAPMVMAPAVDAAPEVLAVETLTASEPITLETQNLVVPPLVEAPVAEAPVAEEVLTVENLPVAAPLDVIIPSFTAVEAPVVEEVLTTPPAVDVVPSAIALAVLTEAAPVAAEAPVPTIDIDTQPLTNLPPLSGTFAAEAAAQCMIGFNGDQVTAVDCAVLDEQMNPGTTIFFTNAANPAQQVTTTLGEGSVTVPTRGFLNETVVSDGVTRLKAVVSNFLRIG